QWQINSRDKGMNLFACARRLGAGVPLADAVQLAGAALAGWAVWRSFRKPFASELRIAVLLAATVFAAPHVMNYDGVLLSAAATFFLSHNLRHKAHRGETALAAVLWLCPLFNPPSVFFAGITTPILIALFATRILEHHPSPYPALSGGTASATA
ncbi:MAG: hypothetical protein KJS68_11430, partial [Alphaproteobacteria bacterium]|nr:hypothetical protein [Alphaproteobacteria bacterium]